MGKDAQGISHELFYLKDGNQESVQCINMRIERCKGYTVAYSYSTPIAVYPDEGGYVLLDSGHFSASTDRHQAYIRQAVPADVELISFDWYDCNDTCWRYCYWYSYKVVLKKFLTAMEKHVREIGKWNPDAFVYARDRNRILADLQALHRFFSMFDRKRAVQAVERKVAYINDPVRIKAGQKRCAAEKAEERRKQREQQRERSLTNCVTDFFRRHGEITPVFAERARRMVEQFPLVLLKDFQRYAHATSAPGPDGIVRERVANTAFSLIKKAWQERCGIDFGKSCDIWLARDGDTTAFVTTMHVHVGYGEVQRCLKLWKRGRIVGAMVDGKYNAVRNTDSELVIGCHTFPRKVVEAIYARYAGKTEEVILKVQETMCRQFVHDTLTLVADFECEVLEAMKADPATTADLDRLGVSLTEMNNAA